MGATPATFAETLRASGLALRKAGPFTLQVNTGLACNLSCRHCHLEAGPDRSEVMGREVMEEVIELARRAAFEAVDVTGGAPELVPGIRWLLGELAPLAGRRIFRTNLLALADRPELIDTLHRAGWSLAASLPWPRRSQVAALRGEGVFEASLDMLRRLNRAGFGTGGPLALHLASNPAGAFAPPDQCAAEKLFRKELAAHGVTFDTLFVFANVPLGRFRGWLARSGNLEGYLGSLRGRFNPGVVEGLMCRSIVSVAWDGRVHDCDFNLAAGLPSLAARHVREFRADAAEGAEIPTGEHCFACTAGAGFT